MNRQRPGSRVVFALGAWLAASGGPAIADWPQFRGNAQRTAVALQPVESDTWHRAWSTRPEGPPSRTWPPAARGSLWQNLEHIEHRVAEDRCDVPILATDNDGASHLLVAHSASNRLVAYQPYTGELQWEFYCEAPIRFAPATASGIAYFGADDGIVRAVNLTDGKLIWKTRLGPKHPWIVGNGRLISPHPIRTSVLISGGKLFAAAGLFPSQGVYLVALSVEDGRLLWRRSLRQSPQGYLLAEGSSRLIVPAGRAEPFAVEQATGGNLQTLPSPGGAFCMLTSDAFFAGPGNSPSVTAYEKSNATSLMPFQGNVVAAFQDLVWVANRSWLTCFRRTQESPGQAVGFEEIWACEVPFVNDMIGAGMPDSMRLYIASSDGIQIRDARRGTLLNSIDLGDAAKPDSTLRLAVSAVQRRTPTGQDEIGCLVAISDTGHMWAWTSELLDTELPDTARKPEAESPAASPEEQELGLSAASRHVEHALETLRSDAGFALVVNDDSASSLSAVMERCQTIVQRTRLHVVLAVPDERFHAACQWMRRQELLGRRVSVTRLAPPNLQFDDGLFNLVIGDSTKQSAWSQELLRCCAPGGVSLTGMPLAPVRRTKPFDALAGQWRHQYAGANNVADSGDQIVGRAADFRLRWFGGVGPNRIPDRHLRGPAPLAARDVFVIHGDGVLIGVDPANGVERWQVELPDDSMRYVIPFDGGYTALSRDGQSLFVAAAGHVLQLDPYRGETRAKLPLPQDLREGFYWGYLATLDGDLLASAMRKSAPRLRLETKAARSAYSDQDYRSGRPLVCSRRLFRLRQEGQEKWAYTSRGVIPHSTIAASAASGHIVLVEGRSPACQEHPSDRVHLEHILEDGRLVCLDAETGGKVWTQQLDWPEARNVIYTQVFRDYVVLVSSGDENDQAEYHVMVRSLDDGRRLWAHSHQHVRKGLYHGEQVHHPVLLTRPDGQAVLVVEPYLYALQSGDRLSPNGSEEAWALQRPGHSCGTLTGAGNCLFFRASNPTVLNLQRPTATQFTALAPSRPSCWINMIPATGLVLIPEGSASCVCKYPLQTSMAFAPVQRELEVLPDYPLPHQQATAPRYRWDFAEAQAGASSIAPELGEVVLRSREPLHTEGSAITFDGRQWLTPDFETPDLPPFPSRITLSAWVKVYPNNPSWTAFVAGLQDNGNYERGCILGLHDNEVVFGIAASATQRMTYLHTGSPLAHAQWHFVVGTYDGRTMRLYVDAKLKAVSVEQTGDLLTDPSSWLTVGAYKDANEFYPFQGELRRVSIWNGALTPEQVKRLYDEDAP